MDMRFVLILNYKHVRTAGFRVKYTWIGYFDRIPEKRQGQGKKSSTGNTLKGCTDSIKGKDRGNGRRDRMRDRMQDRMQGQNTGTGYRNSVH